MPQHPETIGFEIVKESWLEILLPDGIRVRARPQLVFLHRERGGSRAQFGFKTAMTITTLSPSSMRGKPTKMPDIQKEKPRATYSPEDWKVVSQAECIYRTAEGALMFIRTTPNSISRFDSYTHEGEPFIVLNHTTGVEFANPFPAQGVESDQHPTSRVG